MPTYGYKCNQCEHTFEVIQKITDDPLKECEKCGGEVKRLIFPVGIAFKGSGFHINDYRKTDTSSGKSSSSAKDSASEAVSKAAEKVEAK